MKYLILILILSSCTPSITKRTFTDMIVTGITADNHKADTCRIWIEGYNIDSTYGDGFWFLSPCDRVKINQRVMWVNEEEYRRYKEFQRELSKLK